MMNLFYLMILSAIAAGIYLLLSAFNRMPQQIAQWISKILTWCAIAVIIAGALVLFAFDVATSVNLNGFDPLYFSTISTFLLMVAIWLYQRNNTQ